MVNLLGDYDGNKAWFQYSLTLLVAVVAAVYLKTVNNVVGVLGFLGAYAGLFYFRKDKDAGVKAEISYLLLSIFFNWALLMYSGFRLLQFKTGIADKQE